MDVLIIPSKFTNKTTKMLMKDLNKFLTSKVDLRVDNRKDIESLKEILEINECKRILYFENTKRFQYLWIGDEDSYSIKCLIDEIYTLEMINSVENPSKKHGFLLSFSEDFDSDEKLKIFKKLIRSVFLESKESDRIFCFFYFDDCIYVRHYKINDGVKEIGPRFSLKIDKILDGFFQGKRLF